MQTLCKALLENDAIEIVNFTTSFQRSPAATLSVLSRAVLPFHPSLKILHLSYNRLQDVRALGKALESNRNLEELYLDYNQIDCDSAIFLAKGLGRNSTLKVLQLNSNSIGETGGEALGEVLYSRNHTLQRLGLRNNQLGLHSTRAFSEALSNNYALCVLELHENHRIPRQCMESLHFLAKANNAGRYALRDHYFPLARWSIILENLKPDMVMFFLGQKPALVPQEHSSVVPFDVIPTSSYRNEESSMDIEH